MKKLLLTILDIAALDKSALTYDNYYSTPEQILFGILIILLVMSLLLLSIYKQRSSGGDCGRYMQTGYCKFPLPLSAGGKRAAQKRFLL